MDWNIDLHLLTSLSRVRALWKMTYSSPLSSALLTKPPFVVLSPTVNFQDSLYTGAFGIAAAM